MHLTRSQSVRSHISRLVALAFLASLTVAACTESGNKAEPDTEARFGGLWQTEGYGLVLDARGDRAQVHEVTAVSCMPLIQSGDPRIDGCRREGSPGAAGRRCEDRPPTRGR